MTDLKKALAEIEARRQAIYLACDESVAKDVDETLGRLIRALRIASAALGIIPGMCGNPDAADACRLIMKRANKTNAEISRILSGEEGT